MYENCVYMNHFSVVVNHFIAAMRKKHVFFNIPLKRREDNVNQLKQERNEKRANRMSLVTYLPFPIQSH